MGLRLVHGRHELPVYACYDLGLFPKVLCAIVVVLRGGTLKSWSLGGGDLFTCAALSKGINADLLVLNYSPQEQVSEQSMCWAAPWILIFLPHMQPFSHSALGKTPAELLSAQHCEPKIYLTAEATQPWECCCSCMMWTRQSVTTDFYLCYIVMAMDGPFELMFWGIPNAGPTGRKTLFFSPSNLALKSGGGRAVWNVCSGWFSPPLTSCVTPSM